MRRFLSSICFVVFALGIAACSSASEGGELNSDEGLHAFMNAIALDFAGVLADLAPANEALSAKDGETVCPEGGGATWTDSGFGTGTLGLTECGMRGLQLSGTLSGYLESGPASVDAQLGGPVTVVGGFSGQLNVSRLILQADVPPTHDLTYWEVEATDANGKMLCAWSGGPGCAPLL